MAEVSAKAPPSVRYRFRRRDRAAQAEAFITATAELITEDALVAVGDHLLDMSYAEQRSAAQDAQKTERAIQNAVQRVIRASAAQDIARTISSQLLGRLVVITGMVLPPVIALLTAGSIENWGWRLAACLVAGIVATAVLYGVGILIGRLSEAERTSRVVARYGSIDILLVVIGAAVLALIRDPHAFPGLGAWPWQPLESGWLHVAINAAFWSYGVFGLAYLTAYMWSYVISRRVRRGLEQIPLDHLIYRLLTLIIRLAPRRWPAGVPDDVDEQLEYVRDLEDTAIQFELEWRKLRGTGVAHIDERARSDARAIVAGVRAQERALHADRITLTELHTRLAKVVSDIALRRIPASGPEPEVYSLRRSWLRRLLAGILGAAAILMLIVAGCQPWLPHFIAGLGATELARILDIDGDRQQVLATLGALFLPLALTTFVHSPPPLKFVRGA